MAQHLDNGRFAERVARRFLIDRGLSPVIANYRCRFGELDLVMRDGALLVIVEIRYRRRSDYGGPIASISSAKRRKIALATEQFILRFPAYRDAPVRFDVVGLGGTLSAPDIHWIPGAFTMDDC